jgi:hypothetical protein
MFLNNLKLRLDFRQDRNRGPIALIALIERILNESMFTFGGESGPIGHSRKPRVNE